MRVDITIGDITEYYEGEPKEIIEVMKYRNDEANTDSNKFPPAAHKLEHTVNADNWGVSKTHPTRGGEE